MKTEFLFTGDTSGQVCVWQKLENNYNVIYKQQTGEPIKFLAYFSPKNFLFVVTNTKILVWDFEKDEVITSFETTNLAITNFLVVNNSIWISSGKEIFVYSITKMINKTENRSAKELGSVIVRNIREHDSKVVSLASIKDFSVNFVDKDEMFIIY